MTIRLTEEQRQQLNSASGTPADVVDPDGQRRYVLISAEEYDAICDERDQAALRQAFVRNLGARLAEGE